MGGQLGVGIFMALLRFLDFELLLRNHNCLRGSRHGWYGLERSLRMSGAVVRRKMDDSTSFKTHRGSGEEIQLGGMTTQIRSSEILWTHRSTAGWSGFKAHWLILKMFRNTPANSPSVGSLHLMNLWVMLRALTRGARYARCFELVCIARPFSGLCT